MKYLIVLGVVACAIWLWRHNREQAVNAQRQAPRPKPAMAPTDMVVCHHCGIHLPLTEAVQGQRGYYCGQAHRQLNER